MVAVIRDLSELDPRVRPLIERVLAACERAGLPMRVFETYRPNSRQAELYAQGRRGIKGEKKVTGCKPGQSPHNYRLAADFAWWVNGSWTWDEKKAGHTWAQFGAIVRAISGLEWGGGWKSGDTPHVELRLWREAIKSAGGAGHTGRETAPPPEPAITITYKAAPLPVPVKVEDGTAWIRARDLTLLGHKVGWEPGKRIVQIDE